MSAGDRKHPARLSRSEVAPRHELVELVIYALILGAILTGIAAGWFGVIEP